jgi:hypothetical protein
MRDRLLKGRLIGESAMVETIVTWLGKLVIFLIVLHYGRQIAAKRESKQ